MLTFQYVWLSAGPIYGSDSSSSVPVFDFLSLSWCHTIPSLLHLLLDWTITANRWSPYKGLKLYEWYVDEKNFEMQNYREQRCHSNLSSWSRSSKLSNTLGTQRCFNATKTWCVITSLHPSHLTNKPKKSTSISPGLSIASSFTNLPQSVW